MVALTIILGVAAGVLAIVVGVLIAARGRLLVREAEARTEADRARQEIERLRARDAALSEELEKSRAAAHEARADVASMEATLREKEQALARRERELEDRLRTLFTSLAAESLEKSQQRLAEAARTDRERAEQNVRSNLEKFEGLVKPIATTLERLEKDRTTAGGRLDERLRELGEASERVRAETARLARALQRPEVRGRYGEIQLRRVAELAGMTAYCDFAEQAGTRDDAGRALRPDMVVRLPGDRVLAIDAKTNIQAYIDAASAESDEAREEKLDQFARHVAEQVRALAGKRYWAEFEGSPDFVVMFVPGDQFVDAALSRRPGLIEDAAERNVILASPSTLIGLLRAVAVGWRERGIEEEARQLLTLGRELHDRARVVFEHVDGLSGAIEQTVKRYNDLTGSMRARLIPTLRKFESAGADSGKGEVEAPAEITIRPNPLRIAGPAADGDAPLLDARGD